MSERTVRKQVYIEAHQELRLKELASRLGVPESSLIRHGSDLTLREGSPASWKLEMWERELEFARSLPTNTEPRTWTRDDLYDR